MLCRMLSFLQLCVRAFILLRPMVCISCRQDLQLVPLAEPLTCVVYLEIESRMRSLEAFFQWLLNDLYIQDKDSSTKIKTALILFTIQKVGT